MGVIPLLEWKAQRQNRGIQTEPQGSSTLEPAGLELKRGKV